MDEIITAISQVGFPIAISVYLLVRFEQKMEKLENVIIEQKNIILDQKNEIVDLKEKILELRDIIKEGGKK